MAVAKYDVRERERNEERWWVGVTFLFNFGLFFSSLIFNATFFFFFFFL